MKLGVVTLFPELFDRLLDHSMLARAKQKGLWSLETASPRDFATDVHRTVDDSPYGGGPGMVLKVDVVVAAAESLSTLGQGPVLVMDPAGTPMKQSRVRSLAQEKCVTFICGHYEGMDERVLDVLGAEPVSVCDFVVTGGELPAMMLIDALVRLQPGVLGDPESHEDDSFGEDSLLGFPLYTRPLEFRGHKVSDVMASGHHGKVAELRRLQRLLRTMERRPDLMSQAELTKSDMKLLKKALEAKELEAGLMDD